MSSQPIKCQYCKKIFFDIGNNKCPFCKKDLGSDMSIFDNIFGKDNNSFNDKIFGGRK